MNGQRTGSVDFFRGLALVFIFWDHIPGNVLGDLTVRNIGLSDAAEIFVFLAGYSAALAYGRVLARDGLRAACNRVLRRAGTLYVAHIFILVLLMGVVVIANAHVETRDFVREMHLSRFLTAPEQALVEALTLRFKPSLMDPLPLYILLLLALAAVLPLLARYPRLVIAGSALLYGLTVHFNWNLPDQPGAGWFFNPLAWQLLFFLGGAFALHGWTWLPVRPGRWSVSLAAVVVAASAVLVWSWGRPDLHDAVMPRLVAEWLYPIDKSNLDILRIVHFLALAHLVAASLPAGAQFAGAPWQPVSRMGRYSLEVYCLGVVLAPLADAAIALIDDRSLVVQAAVGLSGAAMMAAFAGVLEWSRRAAAPRPLAAS